MGLSVAAVVARKSARLGDRGRWRDNTSCWGRCRRGNLFRLTDVIISLMRRTVQFALHVNNVCNIRRDAVIRGRGNGNGNCLAPGRDNGVRAVRYGISCTCYDNSGTAAFCSGRPINRNVRVALRKPARVGGVRRAVSDVAIRVRDTFRILAQPPPANRIIQTVEVALQAGCRS